MQEKRFKKGRTLRFAALVCALAIGASVLAYVKQDRTPEQLSTAPTPQVVERPEQDGVVPPAQRNARKSVDAASVQADPEEQPEKAPAGEPEKEETAAFTIAMPAEGDLVQLYSMDHLSYDPTTRDWRTHDGIDIRAAVGAEVRAAADGTVAAVETDGPLGTVVTIRHPGGYLTRYGNLDEVPAVETGQEVRRGEAIGTVGATALLESAQESHLHFELCAGGTSLDPTDYFTW